MDRTISGRLKNHFRDITIELYLRCRAFRTCSKADCSCNRGSNVVPFLKAFFISVVWPSSGQPNLPYCEPGNRDQEAGLRSAAVRSEALPHLIYFSPASYSSFSTVLKRCPLHFGFESTVSLHQSRTLPHPPSTGGNKTCHRANPSIGKKLGALLSFLTML